MIYLPSDVYTWLSWRPVQIALYILTGVGIGYVLASIIMTVSECDYLGYGMPWC